jgi:hypothetical protein
MNRPLSVPCPCAGRRCPRPISQLLRKDFLRRWGGKTPRRQRGRRDGLGKHRRLAMDIRLSIFQHKDPRGPSICISSFSTDPPPPAKTVDCSRHKLAYRLLARGQGVMATRAPSEPTKSRLTQFACLLQWLTLFKIPTLRREWYGTSYRQTRSLSL